LALHVCTQVAHALHYAHEAKDAQGHALNIVHRDVSPDNILISWDGDVKLSDFGIALATGRAEKTAQGMTKGKLAYMAPEQATGGTVDARADIFSLGCVLHRLVAGESPMASEEALARLLTGKLLLSHRLPDDIQPLVAKAVRRSRFDRFATAAEMAEAMSGVLAARISRDSRIALREWVGRLRPAGEKTDPAQPQGEGEWVLDSPSDALPVFVTKPTTVEPKR